MTPAPPGTAGRLAITWFLLCAGPSALAQSTLPDGTCAVVTDKGFFLVRTGQPAVQLLDATPFGGGSLDRPSVTWIHGTDDFIVTRRDLTGSGGLWRVHLQPGGGAAVHDLSAAMPVGAGRDFTDSDYSVGLDALFLLERQSGRLLVEPHFASGSAAGFTTWASVPPAACLALAVRGAKQPFSVLVTQSTGEVLRVTPDGATFLNEDHNPSWSQATTDPWFGEYFLASKSQSKIVVGNKDLPGGLPQALQDLNVYDYGGVPCGPLARYPLDIAYEARSQRVVALAGGDVPDCAFDGEAIGKHHVIRLPYVASGPPGTEPDLLSATGDSGISGVDGDLALVQLALADVTWYGAPGSGVGTSAPFFGGSGFASPLTIGGSATEGVGGAPPGAAAVLVLGLTALDMQLQGQLLGPYPQWLLPALTDAAGEAQVTFPVPPLPELVGVRVFMQWWIDDTTTPAAGDRVSSQVGIFTIGAP